MKAPPHSTRVTMSILKKADQNSVQKANFTEIKHYMYQHKTNSKYVNNFEVNFVFGITDRQAELRVHRYFKMSKFTNVNKQLSPPWNNTSIACYIKCIKNYVNMQKNQTNKKNPNPLLPTYPFKHNILYVNQPRQKKHTISSYLLHKVMYQAPELTFTWFWCW